MSENEECGLKIFQSTPSKYRKINEFGTAVSRIDNLDEWSDLFEKQDQMEKLRLYYTLVAWKILRKVYPRHRIFTKYDEVLTSPEFIQQKLKNVSSEIDDISDSLSLLGSIPQYNMLSNEQCPRIPRCRPKILPKTEPFDT